MATKEWKDMSNKPNSSEDWFTEATEPYEKAFLHNLAMGIIKITSEDYVEALKEDNKDEIAFNEKFMKSELFDLWANVFANGNTKSNMYINGKNMINALRKQANK